MNENKNFKICYALLKETKEKLCYAMLFLIIKQKQANKRENERMKIFPEC